MGTTHTDTVSNGWRQVPDLTFLVTPSKSCTDCSILTFTSDTLACPSPPKSDLS